MSVRKPVGTANAATLTGTLRHMTDLQELRTLMQRFSAEREWERFHDPKSLALALVGEVGELAELLQWLAADQVAALALEEPLHSRLGEELADVLLYLVRLADVLQVDLSAAVVAKAADNAERFPAPVVDGIDEALTVVAIARRLGDARHVVPPGQVQGLQHLDGAGLYAWHVDEVGAETLSAGAGLPVGPGLVYVGQAGAAGRTSASGATLRQRLLRQHLRGNVRSSTWRKSLAAVLSEVLDLRPGKGGRLADGSEERLSGWMEEHLSVVALPLAAATLLDVESEVVGLLDPPFNLRGVPTSPLRTHLKQRRMPRRA